MLEKISIPFAKTESSNFSKLSMFLLAKKVISQSPLPRIYSCFFKHFLLAHDLIGDNLIFLSERTPKSKKGQKIAYMALIRSINLLVISPIWKTSNIRYITLSLKLPASAFKKKLDPFNLMFVIDYLKE